MKVQLETKINQTNCYKTNPPPKKKKPQNLNKNTIEFFWGSLLLLGMGPVLKC